MVLQPAFVPAGGTAEVQFRNFPRVTQEIEIAVDGPFADIRYHFPDLVVYPVGGRVSVRCPEDTENSFFLPGYSPLHNSNKSY